MTPPRALPALRGPVAIASSFIVACLGCAAALPLAVPLINHPLIIRQAATFTMFDKNTLPNDAFTRYGSLG